jgi:hypothetical protein
MKTAIRLVVRMTLLAAAGLARAAPDDAAPAQRLHDAGCLSAEAATATSGEIEAAKKECPDQTPTLRIETGTHTNAIKSIAVDAACTIAVTGSDDKTARLWSLPEGRLLRTFRPPIGTGNGGRIYAVALSLDGRWIAIGGWDVHGDLDGAYGVYIYSRDGGGVRRIGAFDNAVFSLAFSPDGQRLAAGLGRDAGVSVLDFATGHEITRLSGYGKLVYGLAWARDGSLYTASIDGKVRAYGPDLNPTPRKTLETRDNPFRLAISPDQRRLAIGFFDKARADLVALPDLTPAAAADVAGANRGLSSVAWVDDDTLQGAGWATDNAGRVFVRVWNPDGHRRGPDSPVSASTVFDLKPCGTGTAFAAFDPRFGLLDRSGAVRMAVDSAAIQMQGVWYDGFRVSPDARQAAFALDVQGKRPVVFDLASSSLRGVPTAPAEFLKARKTGLEITDWFGSFSPKLDGRALALDEQEFSYSLAIRRDAKRFFLGTNFYLRAYDAKGAEAAPPKAFAGVVWALDLAADDRILVAATGGGTIHWLRSSDLAELLTLFVDARDKRWVAWTPSGYYMASAGGEDLIGWNVNRGWSQEAEFYPASAFHDRFYRPDIVQRVLETLDEKEAIKLADAARALVPAAQGAAKNAAASPDSPGAAAALVAANLPPQAFVTAPNDGARFAGDSVTVAYRVRSAAGGMIDSLAIEVDGRPLVTQKHLSDGAEGEVVVPAPKRDFVVGLTPTAGGRVGLPATVKLVYAGAPPPAPPKPNLHVIAIGVDTYENAAEFPRTYAEEDVNALVDALKKQEGPFYGHVEVTTLLGEHADILEWRKAFGNLNLNDSDTLLVYLVGHGWIDTEGEFHFLTRSASMADPDGTMLSEDDLLNPLKRVVGRKIIMFETCHAGAAAENAKGSELDMNNVFNRIKTKSFVAFFGATDGTGLARFDPQWKNRGAFTQAIVEGLGGAAKTKDGLITINSLSEYVANRVGALTDQHQLPMEKQTVVDNFPLAKAPN